MHDLIAGSSDFIKITDDISEVAGLLWQKGWAERNAGNLSYNISQAFDSAPMGFDFGAFQQLDRKYPNLRNQAILLTATGSRMRDVAKAPYQNTCIIYLDGEGGKYRQLINPEFDVELLPTSELPTHLAIHEMLIGKKRKEKVVVHTHPNNLLSLSHIREFCHQGKINNMLWGMQPETCVFVGDGLGFVPYLMTGSEELAGATIKKLKNHRVVMWEKHGCLAIGETANDAFDLLDVLDKSASLFLTCKSAGYNAGGISKNDLNDLRRKFDV